MDNFFADFLPLKTDGDNDYFWITVLTFILFGALLFNYLFHLKRTTINKTVDQQLTHKYNSNMITEAKKLDDLHHPEAVATYPLHLSNDDYDSSNLHPDKLIKYPVQLRDPYITASKVEVGPIIGNIVPVDIYDTGYTEYYKVGFIYSGAPHYHRIQLFSRKQDPYNSYEYYIQAPNGVDKIKLSYKKINDADILVNVPGYTGVKFQATIYNDDADSVRYNPFF